MHVYAHEGLLSEFQTGDLRMNMCMGTHYAPKCTVCGRMFASEATLAEHLKTVHGVTDA